MVYEIKQKIQVFDVAINKLINPSTNNLLAFVLYANQAYTTILAKAKKHILTTTNVPIYNNLNDADMKLLILLVIDKTHKEIAHILSLLHNKKSQLIVSPCA